ncbi:complement factor H-like isoform X3 [Perca fluviatilis]|uniref:complement factor H-like isoform X3 n=1 Tax=Perca fluviatilis TaxID=8168 RepID=UPI0019653CA8|nr:complement factor H-like isoform X3 [Perca fluviatilis]
MHVINPICVLLLWVHTLTFALIPDCTLQQFLNGPKYDSNFDTSGLQPSYPAGKQIRVACTVGYSGFFKLTCVEGKWESRGTVCQPKSCGHPGDAQFADFNLEVGDDFVFGSKVVYTCHKGYQMVSRTNSRRCMNEGWDGVIPVCEAQQCPVIHVDNNVQVNGDPEEATYGNVVRFSCKSNSYILSDPASAELYCDENGEWSGQPPKCIEIKCAVHQIENGQVSDRDIREYKEHDVLQFRCDVGYKRTEDRPSKCTKVGIRAEWTPTPACEPIKCKLLLTPGEGTRYGSVSRNVFLPGEILRVICEAKYGISNNQESAVTTCNEDGEWSIRPICTEVVCSNRKPQHVYSWGIPYWRNQPYKMGETINYRCETGFKSTDDATLATCTRDGWTPNPLCQEITCDRKDIQEAEVISEYKQTYRYNEQVRYVCREGYQGQFTLTCRENGWIGNQKCTEITCDRKHDPKAEVISEHKQRYRYNEQVRYRCREGYRGGEFTLTCGGDGWIGRSTCREITCNRKDIPKAEVISEYKQTYRYNEQVGYRCREGYQGGEFTLTCGGDGWTGSPTCTEVVCSNRRPQHVDYWGIPYWRNQPYKMGETINYRCERGFKSTDDATLATCTRDGWTPNPLCQEITCDRKDIQEADVIGEYKQRYRYNEQVGYVCREGYQGQFTLTCRENGWIGNPRCTEITCNRKDIPKAEVISEYKQTYRYNEQVGYRCRDGYQEQFTLTCGGDGWTGSPTCTEITCDRKDIPKADVIGEYKQRYRYDEQVGYVCREGYQGQFTLTCGENGWIANPRCTEITCDRKNVPKAEVISEYKQTYRYNEQVRYRCREGYQGGEFTLTCGGDGWIGTPTCRDACPKPEVPNGFAVGPYNNTIYYSCNEGFKLFSNNGWWAEAKCNDSRLQLCIENTKCGETPVIPNGKVVPPQRQDLRQIQARITCNTGYRTQVDNLPCREGEWTSNGILLEDICKPTAKLCNPPPKVEYAVVRTSYQKEYLSDSPVTYQCHDGYDIEGEDTILCNDGKWEEKNITCTEITCDRKNVPKAEVISEYKQTYRYNEQVRYRCRDGYQGGEFTLTCGGDGWIGSPTCREITCDRKDIPKADVISEYKQTYRYNEQVGYRCRDGYQGGEFTLTCGGDGWIGTPTCRESVGCGSPPPLTDGDIKYTIKSNYSHQERVEFMCQRYYTMEGGPNRTCISGEWTGQMRCLKPCIVNEDLYRQHNITIKSSDSTFFSHDEIIEFRCARGVPVGAVAMRQRCNGGVILLPTCQ